jgi:hypothetical protein
MLDTRPEKILRTTYSSHRPPQMRTQTGCGFIRAVRQVALAMCPNIFNRIEFRSIAGKSIHMKTSRIFQECFNIRSFVNRSTVPYENNLFANMAQQILKETDNLVPSDVMSVESEEKADSLTTRRYGKTANRRYFIPPVTVPQDWRTTGWSPCFSDKGNKQEPAFIQKRKMGPKSSGFFLSGARFLLSIPQSLFRPVAMHVFPASGNSIRNSGAVISRLRRLYSEYRILFESAVRYASASINRWNILLKKPLEAGSSLNPFAVDLQGAVVVPISLDFECLGGLLSCTLATTEQLNSAMNPVLSQHPDTFSRSVAW